MRRSTAESWLWAITIFRCGSQHQPEFLCSFSELAVRRARSPDCSGRSCSSAGSEEPAGTAPMRHHLASCSSAAPRLFGCPPAVAGSFAELPGSVRWPTRDPCATAESTVPGRAVAGILSQAMPQQRLLQHGPFDRPLRGAATEAQMSRFVGGIECDSPRVAEVNCILGSAAELLIVEAHRDDGVFGQEQRLASTRYSAIPMFVGNANQPLARTVRQSRRNLRGVCRGSAREGRRRADPRRAASGSPRK